MENLIKPTYKKAGPEDFFKKLQKEVHDNILTDQSIQRLNIIKSFALLIAYFLIYACILIFGNSTVLLFIFYILLGWSTIVLFINAFHDAAHGAVFKTRKQNLL